MGTRPKKTTVDRSKIAVRRHAGPHGPHGNPPISCSGARSFPHACRPGPRTAGRWPTAPAGRTPRRRGGLNESLHGKIHAPDTVNADRSFPHITSYSTAGRSTPCEPTRYDVKPLPTFIRAGAARPMAMPRPRAMPRARPRTPPSSSTTCWEGIWVSPSKARSTHPRTSCNPSP